MDLGLTDRTVLVTGGASGIGAAIARAYSREGARVAVTYRSNEAAGRRIADELGAAHDRACHVRYALEEPESPERAIDEVRRRWGGIDILVANALARGRRRSPDERFDRWPSTEWLPLLSDNLAGTIRTTQLALADMRDRGWGRIVLISSHVAVDGAPGQEIYGAAKSALHGLARSLAWDCGRCGVLVNVVCPGLTMTEGVTSVLPSAVREGERGRTPAGRLSAPEDVANVVLFLGSAGNGNVLGEVVTVAGGR